MAVLLITHDLGVVANMADEVVVVYHGKLMESGCTADIFERPGHPYLQALMRAVPRMGMERGARLTPIREVEREAGGHFAAPRDAPRALDGPLLTVRNVTKVFQIRASGMFGGGSSGAVRALNDVTLHVSRGECLGLVGESGCGKTTLSKVIMRALDPDAGELLYRDGNRDLDLLALSDAELIAFRRKL